MTQKAGNDPFSLTPRFSGVGQGLPRPLTASAVSQLAHLEFHARGLPFCATMSQNLRRLRKSFCHHLSDSPFAPFPPVKGLQHVVKFLCSVRSFAADLLNPK